MKKIIGQEHKVYHIHHDGGKFRQTARHEIGIGLGSMVEPRFVCQARLAPNGFSKMTNWKMNDRKEIRIVPTGHNAI